MNTPESGTKMDLTFDEATEEKMRKWIAETEKIFRQMIRCSASRKVQAKPSVLEGPIGGFADLTREIPVDLTREEKIQRASPKPLHLEGGTKSDLTIDVTPEEKTPNPPVVTPVSPAPESIDKLRIEEMIKKFLQSRPTNPLSETMNLLDTKHLREGKAKQFLTKNLAEFVKYAEKWAWRRSCFKQTHGAHEIRGVFEGAIAAGKTTFARVFAKFLRNANCKMTKKHPSLPKGKLPLVNVSQHEERVPPKSLKKYYAKLTAMDRDHPKHIEEAAQIQFYIMANRIAQFADFGTYAAGADLHLQDRLFGDMHFMMCNIRDGIVSDEEIETYIPLWSGPCAALPPPDFVVVLEPLGDSVVQNNKLRMEGLRATATKILGILSDGLADPSEIDNSPRGLQVCKKVLDEFPGVAYTWECAGVNLKEPKWSEFFQLAIEMRERNGEGMLDAEWLRKHSADYLETMREVEKAIGHLVQFVHVPYSTPTFPDVAEVARKIVALEPVLNGDE